MAQQAGREQVYTVAERFVQQGARDTTVPSSRQEKAIWSAENIEDLYERFVRNPDGSSDSFEVKFRRQLEGAPDRNKAARGRASLHLPHLYIQHTTASTKRRIIRGVLDGTSISVPDDLEQALDRGIAGFGPAISEPTMASHDAPGILPRVEDDARRREVALSDPWTF